MLADLATGIGAEITQPWLFVVTVFVLNLTPGADLLLTLQHSWQGGWRQGLAAAAGICTGCAVHAILGSLGLAAVLVRWPEVFEWLRWLGAAYLLWLGWGLFRQGWAAARRRDVGAARAERASGDRVDEISIASGSEHATSATPVTFWRAAFVQGLLTNVLNPKIVLFFLALLPPFVAAGASHPALAFAFLGIWLSLQSWFFLAAVVALVVWLRSRVRSLRPDPRQTQAGIFSWQAGLPWAGGTLLWMLAWRLAFSPRG